MKRDTIAAIATAMSNSGIGIIRVSGDDSIDIVDYVLRIEEKFGCNIDEFDTLSQHMRTVGEMIGYLAQFLENGEGTNDG
mgnify:CR=1 FL=1